VNRHRDTNKNLRTQLQRIIRRAGLKPWPKLFHNLRASRETELMADHPIHVVCAWIGNSALIAKKHYLQVTDDDYTKATAQRGAAKSAAEALQKALQSVHVRSGQDVAELQEAAKNMGFGLELTATGVSAEYGPIPPAGL